MGNMSAKEVKDFRDAGICEVYKRFDIKLYKEMMSIRPTSTREIKTFVYLGLYKQPFGFDLGLYKEIADINPSSLEELELYMAAGVRNKEGQFDVPLYKEIIASPFSLEEVKSYFDAGAFIAFDNFTRIKGNDARMCVDFKRMLLLKVNNISPSALKEVLGIKLTNGEKLTLNQIIILFEKGYTVEELKIYDTIFSYKEYLDRKR